MTLVVPRLHNVELELEAAQYLGGWRPETGSVFLPILSDARVGDEGVIRIGISNQIIRATLFGRISMVRRMGRPSLPPGVEIAIEHMSLPAAAFLAMAARGERVTFRERAPRYVVSRRLVILRNAVEREIDTINLSEGGCALGWSGPSPRVGEVLFLKLGDGFLAARARAAVCWTSQGGAPGAFGLRIIAEGRAARLWKAMIAQAAAAGARAA